MARKRKKRLSSINGRTVRDTNVISKTRGGLYRPHFFRRDLREVEDHRRWRPHVQEYLRIIDGRPVGYALDKAKFNAYKGLGFTKLAFKEPFRTIICIRRKQRRIAMFARGQIGKGIAVKGLRRFTKNSEVKC